MSEVAIRVEGLSKKYALGAREPYATLRESLVKALSPASVVRWRRTPADTFWALKDVSFEVRQGDVIGIIGRNGAGKSTLLKILSRITAPTRGRVEIRGRVSSLLEVGTGFHPELTGRENVYLNGAILGMTQAEIRRKFDEIVAFAGIEKFLDTPVKRYSSGMYVRLAFAVAAHLEPEVLIVDEVLAVGDVEFQERCIGKMKQVSSLGRTVLFITHNLQLAESLCRRGLLLDQGRLVACDEMSRVLQSYLAVVQGEHQTEITWAREHAPGNFEARLRGVRITGAALRPGLFASSRPPAIAFEFETEALNPMLCVGFDLIRSDGTVAFRSSHSDLDGERRPRVEVGRNVLVCRLPANLLNGGRYHVAPRISIHCRYWIAELPPVLAFDITADHGCSAIWQSQAEGARTGAVAPLLAWSHAE